MSIQPFLQWLFGPHMFDVGAVLCIGIGLAMALSSDPKDVSAALWFFGIAAVLAIGRAGHWLVTDDSPPLPKPLLAAVLFGAIGALWIFTHSWIDRKLSSTRSESTPEIRPGPNGDFPGLRPAAPTANTPTSIHPDRPAHNSIPEARWLLFKDSPLFTDERKKRITKDLDGFRAFLTKAGMTVPTDVVPIGTSNARRTGSDDIFIPEKKIGEPYEATIAYAQYLVARAINPQWYLQRRFFGPGLGHYTAEMAARDEMSSVLAEYLNWSFWGKHTGDRIARDWLASFWEFREHFGAEFTDRLAIYLIRSFEKEEAAPSIGGKELPSGQPIPMPNPLIDQAVYSHLFDANRVVDNEDAKLPKIKQILAKNGVKVHD